MARKKAKLPVAKPQKPIPVKIVSEPVEAPSTRDMDARERKWRAEDALRDIERAEGHKRDKTLMKDVQSLAKEKMNSLKKIC